MGRRGLLLIASILVAGIGVALIGLYVRGLDAQATQRVAGVQVWIVSKDIPAGTTLSGVFDCSCVRPVTATKETARDAFPVTNATASNSAQKARSLIAAGSILRAAMFSATGAEASRHDNLTAGQQLAITARSVPTGLQAGDQVRIYSQPDDGSAKQIADAEVISAPAAGAGAASVLQLDVDQADAQAIIGAEGRGELVVTALAPSVLASG